MKISIVSPHRTFVGLSDKLIRQGDTLVEPDQGPDLILSDDPLVHVPGVKSVGSGLKIPRIALEAAGLDAQDRSGTITHQWSVWYDWEVGFQGKPILVIPLIGIMDGDLGDDKEVGCVLRQMDAEGLEGMVENIVLAQVLESIKHRGFITFSFSFQVLYGVETGIPGHGMYGVLEGIQGKISSWLVEPEPLLESWTSVLVVSRYPWPFKDKDKQAEVGFTSDIERHFWLLGGERVSKVFLTERTLVGVVTAWHQDLQNACWRARRTAWNVGLEGKQFRLDQGDVARERVRELALRGII